MNRPPKTLSPLLALPRLPPLPPLPRSDPGPLLVAGAAYIGIYFLLRSRIGVSPKTHRSLRESLPTLPDWCVAPLDDEPLPDNVLPFRVPT